MSWVLVIILSIRGRTYKDKRMTMSAQLIIIVVCCRKKCKENKTRMNGRAHCRLFCKQIDIHKKGQWRACSSLPSSFFSKIKFKKKSQWWVVHSSLSSLQSKKQRQKLFFVSSKIKFYNKKSYVKGDRKTI
jgi:hypothetical protein